MKWYKRDPDAALTGMRGLSSDQYKAYGIIIDLLYSRGGDLPPEHIVCSHLEWNSQKWVRVRNELLALGKFHYTICGKLTANRVESEVKLALNRIENTKLARQKASEIKATPLQSTDGQPQPQPDKERKKESIEPLASLAGRPRRKPQIPLPENWSPMEELSSEDLLELERFGDHARANDRRCADWFAAWRNWKRSPYRSKGGQNGHGRRHGSVLDAFDRLGEKLKAAGATDNYVPGSSGPRPLELDQKLRPTGLKLVPSR